MGTNLPTGTVTFLFTDIEGSTRLWLEQPQAMAVSHKHHDAILRQAIESQDGYVLEIVGDAFAAAFCNALDGLQAALSAQRSLQAEAWGETGAIRVRWDCIPAQPKFLGMARNMIMKAIPHWPPPSA